MDTTPNTGPAEVHLTLPDDAEEVGVAGVGTMTRGEAEALVKAGLTDQPDPSERADGSSGSSERAYLVLVVPPGHLLAGSGYQLAGRVTARDHRHALRQALDTQTGMPAAHEAAAAPGGGKLLIVAEGMTHLANVATQTTIDWKD